MNFDEFSLTLCGFRVRIKKTGFEIKFNDFESVTVRYRKPGK